MSLAVNGSSANKAEPYPLRLIFLQGVRHCRVTAPATLRMKKDMRVPPTIMNNGTFLIRDRAVPCEKSCAFSPGFGVMPVQSTRHPSPFAPGTPVELPWQLIHRLQ